MEYWGGGGEGGAKGMLVPLSNYWGEGCPPAPPPLPTPMLLYYYSPNIFVGSSAFCLCFVLHSTMFY